MIKQILLIIAGLCCLLLSGCIDFNNENKVGIVDVERVMRESNAAQAARQHLEAVNQRLDEGWQKLQKTYASVSPKEKEQALTQGLQTLRRQMALEEEAARQVVVNHMLKEIQIWRESTKAQMVLPRHDTLDVAPGLDITRNIIDSMNLGAPTFASLPNVQVQGDGHSQNGASATPDSPASGRKK